MTPFTTDRIAMPSGFWAGLLRLGITASDVARQARLPLTVIQEPALAAAPYFAIWQAYSELMGDAAAGIVKLVSAFASAQYPPAALATFHARDYRDALNRMARYKAMCPPESLRIQEGGELCTLELDSPNGEQPCPPVLVGITLAYLLELGRRGTGRQLTARRVEFSQDMGDVQALEAYFGCRVRAGADANRLTLDRRDLDRPFVSHNEELLEILTPAVDRSLDEQRRSGSISETVKRIMKRSLTGGRPDIAAVASELGLSDRTLQRRLTEDGTTFKSLLARARHERACEYLADPAIDIKEVAFLVGYEDQSSFYRAFRQWEGETPSNWRSEQGMAG
ncbi:helix-turn-helix transcriptional regulator [Cohnella zeiphila]|uniref:Helix-turn-helix domain-containing protein n=1 Tax=Cohnella zeiphila TaxID=2761120 RepID=A0A7X0VYB5_9BACL|nr:AraC family transcriptional regulator [Cohnella zeiphila]MBB6734530.1 helix-turn-helix domain-containing protein [Cohnella zeiphila]